MITQHVHRVVSRILDANDLGTLRGDLRASPMPARTALRRGFGFGGGGDDDGSGDGSGGEHAPDLWDPDATGRGAAHGVGRKEWNLLVVNDEKVINAMAAPGPSWHIPTPQSPFPYRTQLQLGTIVVFTGILPVARDEQGLAAILGHGRSHLTSCDLDGSPYLNHV